MMPGLFPVALLAGAVAAVLLDYGYHRLMHVPFRRGPLKRLFLYHLAHHRFPEDPAILSFRPLRRPLDALLALLGVACWAVLQAATGDPRGAALCAFLLLLPALLYNHAYDALHRWVHLGGEPSLCRTALRRIRAHHLAHHAHGRDVASFRKAGGLSLIFPFV
jgi:sterol desaturase/sphingolipid hydroxylase (fatty acid hydroxylase superfamily)